jgi:hypothetical protein
MELVLDDGLLLEEACVGTGRLHGKTAGIQQRLFVVMVALTIGMEKASQHQVDLEKSLCLHQFWVHMASLGPPPLECPSRVLGPMAPVSLLGCC